MAALTVSYVTSNPFKQEEIKEFLKSAVLQDGRLVKDVLHFDIRQVVVKEVLEVDLVKMVEEEARLAYSRLRIPCIVEHAGLIFSDYLSYSYPGGLTKPMWNALGSHFIKETGSHGRKAVARAVVAYCDGMNISTFVGETTGKIADAPRGGRDFYWDTIFMPDDPHGRAIGLTYAEIVQDAKLGLPYKMKLSQSAKAMQKFVQYFVDHKVGSLWR